jgi:integrase
MPTIAMNGNTARDLKCPEGQTEITYWDDGLPGFGLRCFGIGRRSWLCQYRNKEGVTRRLALGDAKTVKYAKAREAAEKYLATAKTGGDAVGEAKQAKVERRNAITVAELVERYMAHQKTRLRPRSLEEVRRHLAARREGGISKPRHGRALDITPLLKKPAAKVTRRDVVELLESIAAVAPVQANRVRASLSALYSWGMRTGRVEANPVGATFWPAQENPRERVLSGDELALIWRCTGSDVDHDRIVRLLLLTGSRREEVAGMLWPELTLHDDGLATWLLPPSRAKNKRALELMLPVLAVSQLPPKRDDRALVFGEGAGSFSGWSRCKERLDSRIAKMNGVAIPHWTLHDLRRSFVTHLNELEVEPHVVEALVNHAGGIGKAGVASVYNHASYRTQKRAALAMWADYVGKLVGDAVRDTAEIVRLQA